MGSRWRSSEVSSVDEGLAAAEGVDRSRRVGVDPLPRSLLWDDVELEAHEQVSVESLEKQDLGVLRHLELGLVFGVSDLLLLLALLVELALHWALEAT